MAVQGASSSSMYSFTRRRWTYDAFLSFREQDTRPNFTAHLYEALDRKKINAYIDYKLPRGEEISEELLKAIESSRISIVVLSKNYASSRWCLDELMKILECKKTKQQKILPVFYQIDPSDVRHQTKSFGEALAKLKERFKDELMVERWKAALTEVAGLSGFTLGDRTEPELIQEIVQEVSKVIKPKYKNDAAKLLVGMQSRLQDVHNKLRSVEVNDTARILGIFGIGGVGKTTLAKEIYNSFIDQFEYCCFLADVRETSQQEKGLIRLQKTLLREILGDSNLKVRNFNEGIGLIKQFLWSKRVLLLLDDVDQLFQIEKLLGDRDWLGLGSLIIITTRDECLLTNYNVHLRYKMRELNHNEAFQLFCQIVFKKEEPNHAFAELTEDFLLYAGGVPLALEVLGSYLRNRDDMRFWEDALEKYKRIPPDNIQDKLRIGYDGLEESEKSIFLDIACFFAGMCEEYVTNVLNGCGLFPYAGIPILREKSLITIDEDGIVNMHDLLKVMGKEIVRKETEESTKDPGKRSRLWYHEDVHSVLEKNMGTNKTEGILIDLPKKDLIRSSPEAFGKMENLRILINRNALFSKPPSYFSNELRVLDFKNYHGSSFPSNFNGKKLVTLRMANCNIKGLGNNFKNFQNLRFLSFIKCKFLTRIPDTSGLPNLEEVDISCCKRLVEVDQSIGSLSKLVMLSISYCPELNSFPSSLNSRSLRDLTVIDCKNLQYFPEIGLEMKSLISIWFEGTGIKELPSSIGHLTKLRDFNLFGNKNLAHIPSSILQLEHLNHLSLNGGTRVIKHPEMVGEERQYSALPSIFELLSSPPPLNSSISNDGYSSSVVFPKLEILDLNKRLQSKLDSSMFTNCFTTLTRLNLSWSTFVILPRWMDRFVQLRTLSLRYCQQLKKVEELPPTIGMIDAIGCRSLESFPEISKWFEFNTSNLSELDYIDLSGCSKMLVNVASHVAANPIRSKGPEYHHSFTWRLLFPGNKIPNWFYPYNCKEASNSCSRDISIEVELLNPSVIKGIITCVVFETSAAPFNYYHGNAWADISIAVNYDGRCLSSITTTTPLIGSDHVWLAFKDLERFTQAKGSLQLHFHSSSDELLLKRGGVHLVRKDEENAKRKLDDDDDCHFESNWYPQQKRHSLNTTTSYFDKDGEYYILSSDSEDDNKYNFDASSEEIEGWVDLKDGKRRRDEDHCNLEINGYPQQKSQCSSATSIRITEIENDNENPMEDLDLEL